MSERVVIRVSKDAAKMIKAKAEADGIDQGAAADNLIMKAPSSSKVISAEQLDAIKSLAAKMEKTVPETVDRLIKMGISRHKALAKYAKEQKKLVKAKG